MLSEEKKLTEQEKMIEKFQCPGCVCGCGVDCDNFKMESNYGFKCVGHVFGTTLMGFGHIALGLDKGFPSSLTRLIELVPKKIKSNKA